MRNLILIPLLFAVLFCRAQVSFNTFGSGKPSFSAYSGVQYLDVSDPAHTLYVQTTIPFGLSWAVKTKPSYPCYPICSSDFCPLTISCLQSISGYAPNTQLIANTMGNIVWSAVSVDSSSYKCDSLQSRYASSTTDSIFCHKGAYGWVFQYIDTSGGGGSCPYCFDSTQTYQYWSENGNNINGYKFIGTTNFRSLLFTTNDTIRAVVDSLGSVLFNNGNFNYNVVNQTFGVGFNNDRHLLLDTDIFSYPADIFGSVNSLVGLANKAALYRRSGTEDNISIMFGDSLKVPQPFYHCAKFTGRVNGIKWLRAFIGDINPEKYGTLFFLDDSVQTITNSTQYNGASIGTTFWSEYLVNGSIGYTQIGDINKLGNGVNIRIDDAKDSISLFADTIGLNGIVKMSNVPSGGSVDSLLLVKHASNNAVYGVYPHTLGLYAGGGGGGTITLTGNVTGSGTSTISTTIANGVVTNAMLVNSTISGISLGQSLDSLKAGIGLKYTQKKSYYGGANDTLVADTSDYATASQSGFLKYSDWTTFNNKVSSQWITSGSNIYYNSGNVGIGTSTPTQKLEVNGQTRLDSGLSVGTYVAIDSANSGGITIRPFYLHLDSSQIQTLNSIPVDIGLPVTDANHYWSVTRFDIFFIGQFPSTDFNFYLSATSLMPSGNFQWEADWYSEFGSNTGGYSLAIPNYAQNPSMYAFSDDLSITDDGDVNFISGSIDIYGDVELVKK